ncbi:MAG TPA: hypothetical protein VFG68_06590, partial [Fimbriiglobus sp.]|nr:hypothetical protein [Fimbriiglobus sp.]
MSCRVNHGSRPAKSGRLLAGRVFQHPTGTVSAARQVYSGDAGTQGKCQPQGRRQKLSQEAIDYAMAIKIDATALLGEFLRAAEKNSGVKGQLNGKTPSGGPKRRPPEGSTPTLADAGISKRESSDAQVLARAKAIKIDATALLGEFLGRAEKNKGA